MGLRLRSRGVTVILALILSLSCFVVPRVAAVEGDSWETLKPMQEARSGLGVAAVNGKIYAIGGSPDSGFSPSVPRTYVLNARNSVGTNEVYDPATDTWEFREPMPTPRIKFATAVYQDKIYCIGGLTPDGSRGVDRIGVVEVYDPSTDSWETRAPMPSNRSSIGAAVVDGKIYVIGGVRNGTVNRVYDPETDSWALKSPSLTLAETASAVGDKVYVIAESTQIYDVERDTWKFGTSPPDKVWDSAVTAATDGVWAPQRIYLIGVPRHDSEYSTQAYDPEVDAWTAAADLPTKRHHSGVAVVDDRIYVIGGYTYKRPGGFTSKAINERYTPLGYIPEYPTWLPLLLLMVVLTVTAVICNRRMNILNGPA